MTVALRPGEAFNPYRMFRGLFIPEGLVRCSSISAGAKLAWGGLLDTRAKTVVAIRR
jgi:hypothetical protein